jgi:hypothetical protein
MEQIASSSHPDQVSAENSDTAEALSHKMGQIDPFSF